MGINLPLHSYSSQGDRPMTTKTVEEILSKDPVPQACFDVPDAVEFRRFIQQIAKLCNKNYDRDYIRLDVSYDRIVITLLTMDHCGYITSTYFTDIHIQGRDFTRFFDLEELTLAVKNIQKEDTIKISFMKDGEPHYGILQFDFTYEDGAGESTVKILQVAAEPDNYPVPPHIEDKGYVSVALDQQHKKEIKRVIQIIKGQQCKYPYPDEPVKNRHAIICLDQKRLWLMDKCQEFSAAFNHHENIAKPQLPIMTELRPKYGAFQIGELEHLETIPEGYCVLPHKFLEFDQNLAEEVIFTFRPRTEENKDEIVPIFLYYISANTNTEVMIAPYLIESEERR